MENGVVMDTEEGSPQGGNISPLLANIYLNEFDQEYQKRGVAFVRYADDIVLLAKSESDIVNNGWHIYHKDISTYAALSKAS